MSFSIMRSRPEYPLDHFEKFPVLEDSWKIGMRLKTPPTCVLEYTLNKDCKDPVYPMYELPIPIIRRDLLEVLFEMGVDNIEVYDAVLHHPQEGTLTEEFKAFNIEGIVATSPIAAEIMSNYVAYEIETDEIDGVKPDYDLLPENMLLFRLADRMGRIVVNDKIREKIDLGIENGLVFFPLVEGLEDEEID